ncbi:hypothetical protein LWF15_01695 [Kineosporia rhizophila]|uniref:hypothetical protein n=1 Tax=Kineosporia TaxID=49184 RepID=UPI001E4129F5|nr:MULTISPECIES: hypothetical protein [Kineosporia]MCE0534212.1 hypothetical protein [Kineosporia rhizophila]GLY13759.1 hypothetical protein Kisp01_07750 [Kineosporia sp. NBRC 101677]
MKNIRRATAGLVTAAVVTSLVVLAPASPAGAADAPCSITPNSVTVYDRPKTVKLDVKSDFPYWAADVTRDLRFDADDENPRATISPQALYPQNAGKRTATIALLDETGDSTVCEPAFSLMQGSAVTVAVKKTGTKRQVSGTLRQIVFGAVEPWQPAVGQKVAVQYKAKSGKWVTTATVKTTAGGKFKVTKKLGKRTWRVTYAGTATVAPRTSKSITR